MRMVDLSNFDNSRTILSPDNRHVMSKYYDDQQKLIDNNMYILNFSREQVELNQRLYVS